jgi:hypothetical protein
VIKPRSKRACCLQAAAAPAPVPTLAQMMAGGGGGAVPAAGRVPQEDLDREFDLVHQVREFVRSFRRRLDAHQSKKP